MSDLGPVTHPVCPTQEDFPKNSHEAAFNAKVKILDSLWCLGDHRGSPVTHSTGTPIMARPSDSCRAQNKPQKGTKWHKMSHGPPIPRPTTAQSGPLTQPRHAEQGGTQAGSTLQEPGAASGELKRFAALVGPSAASCGPLRAHG